MRVRLDRYELANRQVQFRSLLAFIFGGLGLVFFGFVTWMGILLVVVRTADEPSWGTDGAFYAHRGGFFVALFFGFVPLTVCTLIIAWGVRKRAHFRRLGELAAVARTAPILNTAQLAHALGVTVIEADRLLLDATGAGFIDLTAHGSTPPPAFAPTVAASAPPSGAAPGSGRITTGSVLGGAYRIEEPLGRGGMGEVFAARHLRTGRRYAVKTILAGAIANEDAIRRFEREATAASAIGHPGIVQVHDFNVAPGGFFYLVMDLLEGETLAERLERSKSLAWPDAQRIAVELCAALGAAHDKHLLHRDIKPTNIFLARSAGGGERVVLVDFGLVKPIAESSPVTSTGAVVGTPMYMSPEQARGEQLDVRSDLYSLAAVVFEMATGAPPFLDRTMASVYARLLHDPPPKASSVSKRVPRAADDVLVKALAKDRAARFPSARALGEALADVHEEAATAAPTTERM